MKMAKPRIGAFWSSKNNKFMIHEEISDRVVTDEEFLADPSLLACTNSIMDDGYVQAIVSMQKIVDKSGREDTAERFGQLETKLIIKELVK